MKNLKSLYSLLLIVIVLFVSGCSKSNDPTPSSSTATKTTAQMNMEKVQASIAGTWAFKSVTVTELSSSKTATTSVCAKTELVAANFSNTKWQTVAGLPSFIYGSTGTSVTIQYPCLNGNPTDIESLTIVQNSDTEFTVKMGSIFVFTLIASDVSTSSITATLLNNGSYVSNNLGYKVVYQFTR